MSVDYYVTLSRKYVIYPSVYETEGPVRYKYVNQIEVFKFSPERLLDTYKIEIKQDEKLNRCRLENDLNEFIGGSEKTGIKSILKSVDRFLKTGSLNPKIKVSQYFDFAENEFYSYGKQQKKNMVRGAELLSKKKIAKVLNYDAAEDSTYIQVEFVDDIEADLKNNDESSSSDDLVLGAQSEPYRWKWLPEGSMVSIECKKDDDPLFTVTGVDKSGDGVARCYEVCWSDEDVYYITPPGENLLQRIAPSRSSVKNFLNETFKVMNITFFSTPVAKEWMDADIKM